MSGCYVPGRMRVRLYLLLACCFLPSATVYGSNNDVLAVLYPEVREPYRQIFLNIYQSIKPAYDGRVIGFRLRQTTSPSEVRDWFSQNGVSSVIALGSRSRKLILQMPSAPKTVVGAVLVSPHQSQLPAVTMVPSPPTVVDYLQQLLPQVKRLFVVYTRRDEWLIKEIAMALARSKIQFVGINSKSAGDEARHYRDVMKQMQPKADLLWISPAGISPDRDVLQSILETSWDRDLAVISSNLGDVKRGALFSFYTDSKRMGSQLVEKLAKVAAGEAIYRAVETARAVSISVNSRTADHLGLRFSPLQQEQFGLVYPKRSD